MNRNSETWSNNDSIASVDSSSSVASGLDDGAHTVREYKLAGENSQSIEQRRGENVSRTSTRRSIIGQARSLSLVVTGQQTFDEIPDYEDIPEMGSGLNYPPIPGEERLYLVSFNGPDDPLHPYNWPFVNKIIIIFMVTFFSFCNTIASALLSESKASLMNYFGVGSEVATLITSLYVFGFAAGPIIWGPLSELYGRKLVLVTSTFGYTCFSFAVATAENTQTITICRFFEGFSGSAALVISSATISDLFSSKYRGRAMAPFGMSVLCGPCLAPIISAFTDKNSSLGWRWNAYWSGILGSAVFTSMLFFRETYHPVILVKKAEKIRRKTKNWTIHAPHETISLSVAEIAVKYLARPVYMLFNEPAVLLMSLYGAFIYGLIYLLLTAIPIIFQGRYHFITGIAELPYLSIFVGCLFGGLSLILFDVRYRRALEKSGSNRPIPKERLPSMMVGSVVMAIGLFWLCWTGDYPQHVHWIVPTIGCAFLGYGFLGIFQPCINYVVDSYTIYAASGVAALTIMRSIFGGVFPLFAEQMFTKMHVKWAGTLLGCISVILIPVPFLFYKFDSRLRARSKLAMSD